MKNYFEIITYGENKVADYHYAFKGKSHIFREYDDGQSLLKMYYFYQTLNDEMFTLRASTRSQFLVDVILKNMAISSIVESILELEVNHEKKAMLLDFYYISASRVFNMLDFMDSLQPQVSESIDQILLKDNGKPILTIYSKEAKESKEVEVGDVGSVRIIKI